MSPGGQKSILVHTHVGAGRRNSGYVRGEVFGRERSGSTCADASVSDPNVIGNIDRADLISCDPKHDPRRYRTVVIDLYHYALCVIGNLAPIHVASVQVQPAIMVVRSEFGSDVRRNTMSIKQIRAIAQLAGVSHVTVMKVLLGCQGRPNTTKRTLEATKALGLLPQPLETTTAR